MPALLKPASRLQIASMKISSTGGSRLWLSEVWIRFLLAIVGLGLAFGAALFSTITRESGNLWATLVLASVALVLAVIVGLTTVPYLARRVAVARIRNVFDYDVTRAGIVYVVIVVVVGIAALNTGNNLLYIIVAAMLGAILCSGFASAMVLQNLQLDVQVPEHVFASREAAARIRLRNLRRWPSFSISVVSSPRSTGSKKWRWQATTFSFPSGRAPDKQWFSLPDRQLRLVAVTPAAPEIFQSPAYFPYLPARTELAADVKLCFEQRGRYQQESFGLATRFPFAFLVKTRRVPLTREILVYPSVEPTDEFFEVLPLINGEVESWQQGRGTGLYRIRDYTQEDSARHVDWKATAKSGSLKVREFTREDEPSCASSSIIPSAAQYRAETTERAVRLAASLSWHFAGEPAEVSFATQQYAGDDVHQFLSRLAVIEPEATLLPLHDLQLATGYNIVLTARQRGSIPTTLWTTSYFVFIGDQG